MPLGHKVNHKPDKNLITNYKCVKVTRNPRLSKRLILARMHVLTRVTCMTLIRDGVHTSDIVEGFSVGYLILGRI